MEMTMDFTAPVHDYASRKSLGRRVSFASHSQVRMFEKNHTNSTGSPQSSPNSISSPDPHDHQQSAGNENDYPGRKSRGRRSSVRFSIAGSEDMDMTTVIPSGNFPNRGSAILDEEFDEDEYFDDDNMDVTEAIQGNFARKRSLSMGRQPLSQLNADSPEDPDESRSEANESMQSEGVSEEQSQDAMEFTVPLGQSLRPPPEQDKVWLALKQMTHSGNEPSEPDPHSDDLPMNPEDNGMNLDDAMERLRRARDSLPLSEPAADANYPQDDTFSSTEDSFEDEFDGNKTLNLSQVMGRASLGANSRMSMGYQDSNMDESEVYGNVGQSTPRHSLLPPPESPEPQVEEEPLPQPLRSSVFQPPPPAEPVPQPSAPTTQVSKPAPSGAFTFTPRAPSPAKSKPISETPSKAAKPKPTFSAAFAPPVARPSPKKVTAAIPVAQASPAKRPRTPHEDNVDNLDMGKPSPAKKQMLASVWLNAAEDKRSSPEPAAPKHDVPNPKPLSASKKAPFQAAAAAPAAPESSRPPSAIRRPSGYFAKRKSLAVGFNIPPSSQESTPSATPSSPKKKAVIGKGRASMGSASADAWTRFDKNAGSGASEKPTAPKATEKDAEAAHCLREETRQASAAPSPTRGSPAPARVLAEPPRLPSPERRIRPDVIDVSTILETPEVGDLSGDMAVDVEATQQWREGVQQEYVEEEEVVSFLICLAAHRTYAPSPQPEISIALFFTMTGIKFMDELTAPRRSMHPSQQPIRQPRNPADIPLAEYVTAMAIDVPQLELYSRVSKDLEAWMTKSKVVFAQAEEEAAKVTPELFVEYARADEEGQAELLVSIDCDRLQWNTD